MGRPIRNHCWRPPQGADICDASHLCKSHTPGQTGDQTHLWVPCVQNQAEGPQLCLDLQVEEQREDSQVGSGRRGSTAGSIDGTSSSLARNAVRIFHCYCTVPTHIPTSVTYKCAFTTPALKSREGKEKGGNVEKKNSRICFCSLIFSFPQNPAHKKYSIAHIFIKVPLNRHKTSKTRGLEVSRWVSGTSVLVDVSTKSF